MKIKSALPLATLPLILLALNSHALGQNQIWTTYTTENSGLPDNYVNALTIDRDGGIWIATQNGLASFTGTDWTVYTKSNSGLQDNEILSVAVDAENTIWAGTADGLAKFDGMNWTGFSPVNSGLPHKRVTALQPDTDAIWVGTRNGLAKFDGDNWTVYNTSNSVLPDNRMESLALAGPDLWIGTSNGLAKKSGEVFTIFTTENTPLPGNDIDALTVDADGTIWIGTETGLAQFDGVTWNVFTKGNSDLLDDHFESLAIDFNGTIWGATLQGLANYDGDKFIIYTTENSDIPFDSTRAVAIDANRGKWVGTKKGLARLTFPDESLLRVTTPNGGEFWRAGLDFDVAWHSNLTDSDSIKIDLYRAGAQDSPVAEVAASTGLYRWLVPENQQESSEYQIRITQVNNPSVFDFSDTTFTIEKPRIFTEAVLVPYHPFVNELNNTAMTEGTIYWYYLVTDKNGAPQEPVAANLRLNGPNGFISPVVETAPGSLIRVEVDIKSTGLTEGQTAVLAFPDSMQLDNQSVPLVGAPAAPVITVGGRRYTQTWDFFAAQSAGVSGIVGGAGAGPSVSAARVSVKGVAGVGMLIAVDQNNFLKIGRHFEAGVGAGAKVPSVNSAVGKVNVGASAEVIAKGLVGQSMLFDKNLQSDETKMAKSGYMLETLSLGGATLSPVAGIVLTALIQVLNELAGVNESFEAFQFENYYGLGLEGKVGVAVDAKLGDDSPIGITLAEAMARLALQARYVNGLRQPEIDKFSLIQALDFQVNLFKFSLIPFKEGDNKVMLENGNFSLFSAGTGMAVTESAIFDSAHNPLALQFDLEGATNVNAIFNQVNIYNESFLTRITIPRDVLEALLLALNNALLNATDAFKPPSVAANLTVGPQAIENNIAELLESLDDVYSPDNTPVTVEVFERLGNGLDLSLNVSLDAALGVGVGLDLGFQFKHYESLEYLRERTLVLDANKTLLAESYPEDLDPAQFQSLNNVMTDIFDGLDLLLFNALQKLVEIFEKFVEAAKEFLLDIKDAAEKTTAKVKGTLQKAGKVVVKKFKSGIKRIFSKPFQVPEVKNIYTSNKIAHRHPEGHLELASENSTLYIVGDVYALNFEADEGGIQQAFGSELELSIAVQEEILLEAGFSLQDRDKIRMYQYVDSSYTWIRMEDDLHSHIDTVASMIGYGGSYALGIEVTPDEDDEAPLINKIFPEDGSQIGPLTSLKAELVDEVTGSGLAVARSKLILDGSELAASWAPTVNELFYEVRDSLQTGSHVLEVVAVDNNGNIASETVAFSVGVIDNIDDTPTPRTFEISQNYPNPFNIETNIKYYLPQEGRVQVNVYNINGQFVKTIFDNIQTSGEHIITWDGTNLRGTVVATGLYFYQVKYGEHNVVNRMMLVK